MMKRLAALVLFFALCWPAFAQSPNPDDWNTPGNVSANIERILESVNVGRNGSFTGQLLLNNGASNGASITLQNGGATSPYTLKLPTAAGSTNQPLLYGSTMTWGTLSGNTSKFVTTTGTLNNGDCVAIDASGNFIDNGSPCGSGGGAVSSVTNSDSTLTISPTTGAVVASLNLAHANTWTGQQTFSNTVTQFHLGTNENVLIADNAGIAQIDSINDALNAFENLNLAVNNFAVTIFGTFTVNTGFSVNTSGNLTLGVAGSSQGLIFFQNATSGGITIVPPTGALGSATLTLPDVTDTLTANAATQTLTSKTFDTASNTFKLNGTTLVGLGASFAISSNNLSFATIAADSVLQNASGSAAIPSAVAIPNCGVALNYSTSSHAWSCLAQSASLQAAVANPTGTTNSTGVMMGLAKTITPATTGRILINIYGSVGAGTCPCSETITGRYGTGTAPSNGAAATGTAFVGNQVAQGLSGFANDKVPFHVTQVVTGLSVGTAEWIDVQLAATTGGGTATITNVSVSAIEF